MLIKFLPHQKAASVMVVMNIVIFQMIWWLGVLQGNAIFGLLLILLFCHFYASCQRKLDAKLAGIGFIIGGMIDGGLWLLSIFNFDGVPLWLGLLWSYFAISLIYSLRPLQHFPVAAQMFMGGLAGGFSYFGGAAFDAVTLMPFSQLQISLDLFSGATIQQLQHLGVGPQSVLPSVMIIGVIWAVLLPLLVKLAQFLMQNHEFTCLTHQASK